MLKLTATSAALLLVGTSAEAHINTVFVIALENHNFTQPSAYTDSQQLFGNSAAPYLNSLITPGNPNAAMVSYASNYVNVPPQTAGSPSGAGSVHPSEPNYVWSEAGLAGPRNDADPYPSNVVNAPSLSATLQSNGIGWKSYQEDTDLTTVSGNLTNTVAPNGQWTVPLKSFSGTSPTYTNPYNGSDQYNYAAKHDPQVFFTATNGGNNTTPSNPEASHYAPLQQLSTDLANNTVGQYNWISPDQYNDMHTALTGGFTYDGTHYTGDAAQIAQGDNFLSKVIPLIEASQAFKDNGAIVIWNDETEGEGSIPGQFTSTEIVISPDAKGNAYTNDVTYDHSSDLRTMQEIFGISPDQGVPWLGDAANVNDLSDLFKAGAVPEPTTWALMIAGFGLIGTSLRRRVRFAAKA
jgi:hypothetical protein